MLASQEAAQGGAAAGGPLRPKFRRKERKPQSWKWQPFENQARSDGLKLSHWAPQQNDDDSTPYPFAAFNTSSGIYSYSNDEYQQHLKDDDWTKEDTDHLIDLCQAYDLRFGVIADRWEAKRPRSIEDLKARYYAICRRLIRSRISVEDMDSRQQLLATYSFDKQREVERKRLVQKLFTRTPAQLAEEEALYVEARRLEQNEAKFAADREDLMKLLGGWERVPDSSPRLIAEAGAGVGVGSAGPLPGTPGAALEEAAAGERDKKRRKRAAGEAGAGVEEGEGKTPALASSSAMAITSATKDAGASSSTTTLTSKQKAELKQAHSDELQCITRFDPDSQPLLRPPYPFLLGTPSTVPPVAPSPQNPTSSHGVYLRSTRLLTPRQPQLNRTMQTLSELNPPIGPRLVFPNRTNCEKWEGLLGAVTSGLEMKKMTDRVESELRIAKSRLASLQEARLGKQQAQGQAGVSQAAAASTTSEGAGPSGNNRRSATPRASAIVGGDPSMNPTSRSNSRTSRSHTPAVPTAVKPISQGDDEKIGDNSFDGPGGERKKRRRSSGLSDLDDDDDDDEWKDARAGAGAEEGGEADEQDGSMQVDDDDDDDDDDGEDGEDDEDNDGDDD